MTQLLQLSGKCYVARFINRKLWVIEVKPSTSFTILIDYFNMDDTTFAKLGVIDTLSTID